jgi:hypothetical protein
VERPDDVTRLNFEFEIPRNGGNRARCLLKGKNGADTAPHAGAERQVRISIDVLA